MGGRWNPRKLEREGGRGGREQADKGGGAQPSVVVWHPAAGDGGGEVGRCGRNRHDRLRLPPPASKGKQIPAIRPGRAVSRIATRRGTP